MHTSNGKIMVAHSINLDFVVYCKQSNLLEHLLKGATGLQFSGHGHLPLQSTPCLGWFFSRWPPEFSHCSWHSHRFIAINLLCKNSTMQCITNWVLHSCHAVATAHALLFHIPVSIMCCGLHYTTPTPTLTSFKY